MNVLIFPVLHENKFYLYILSVTIFQFVKPYCLWLTNLVSSIYLWNHCKYTMFIQFYFKIFMFVCFIEHKILIYMSLIKKQKVQSVDNATQVGNW